MFSLKFILAKGETDTPLKKKKANKQQQQRGRPVPAKRVQSSPNDNRPKKRARIEKGFNFFSYLI